MPYLNTFLAQSNLISDLNSLVEKQLSGSEFGFISLLFLFLGGVFASLLPCTYPLYPITANIIKSRSGDTKDWKHPFLYFLGLAFMYFLFGLIASITGGSFNTILRMPEINLLIAILIFILGLSSLELLMIPLFGGDQSKFERAGLLGTFILGMGAGLLSSPCVGPVVVTILISITTSFGNTISLSGVMITSFKMFLFGLGVGIPFLLIGVFGMKLPKSGKWMKTIQLTLGFLVLYFSYIFYEKGMLGLGYNEKEMFHFFLGFILILISSYYYQDSEKFIFEKVKMSLAISFTLVGLVVLFNSSQGKMIQTSTIQIEENSIEQDENLKWNRSKEATFKNVNLNNKKVFIDFYADWCSNCKEFKKLTLSNKELNQALSTVELYKVYDTDKEFETYQNDPRFPELKIGLPFFVIMDKEENVLFKTSDYLKINEMIQTIKE